MESHPPDCRSEGQYAAFQTDPTNLSSPHLALREYQALAWPPHWSTASFAPPPPSLPVASPSIDQSSASSLAGTFGGHPFPHHASIFATGDPSTVLRQPRQPYHIVQAPLATVAPQMTLAIPPMYTPSCTAPVLPQSNSTPKPRCAKRNREEAEESGQGLKATARKKRRAVNVESRFHKALVDIVEPQSSQHTQPRVGHEARKRQPKHRGARPPGPSEGVENIPVLDDSQESHGRMRGDRTETRSRSRAIALGDSPGILNASSRADVPNSSPPIDASAAAAPILPGEAAWYTPAFYEELRNIANILVAQDQAPTSGASDAVAQYGPCIDEAVPGPSVPRTPCSKSRHASTRTTPAGLGQASSSGHLAVESPGSTSGVALKTFLCPFADSSGVCHGRTSEKESTKKRCKTQVSDSEEGAGQQPKAPKPSTFSRPTDVDRHVLSVHMELQVYCKRPHQDGHPLPFARYDGFLRHLRDTCLKKGTHKVAQLKVKNGKHSSIDRQISRRFAFVLMPCYRHDEDFIRGLSVLRAARTALSLERWLRTHYAEDIRRCDCCKELTDEQVDAIKPPPSAMGGPRAQPGLVHASEASDEDGLPPEEEEGVDDEPMSESGHASNLDVGPVSSSGSLSEMHPTAQECPALGFYDLEEQGSQQSSTRGVAPADRHCDGIVQTTDSDDTFCESAGSLYQLETQPWYIDFGSQALDPAATWMSSS